MAQLCLCDLCKELIKFGDRKYIFGYYLVTEADEDTRKQQFEEVVKAIYAGKYTHANEVIKVVEICEKCVGVFGKFMNQRQDELAKSRRAVRKMLVLKTKRDKKGLKERKNG